MENEAFGAPPRWFVAAAIAALLWEIFGCITYVLHVTGDLASLPAGQAAMWAATPAWSVAAYAIAVWVGLAGAVLLVMRRRLAEPLLLVSLLAVLVQFSAYFLDPDLSAATSADGLVIPLAIVLVTWTIFWFARHSKQRGWLR